MKDMTSYDFMVKAKKKVSAFLTDYHKKPIEWTDVFVVWQCKTLQNHKAILAAATPDKLMFEVTYNGDKAEMYLDVYDKIANHCFDDGGDE